MEEPARWVSKDVAARDLEMLRGAAGYIVRLEGLEREQRTSPSQFSRTAYFLGPLSLPPPDGFPVVLG